MISTVFNKSVCLITPPSLFLLDERVFPSLGILRIAAVLEKADVNVEMLDLSGISNFLEVLSLHLKETKAKHIGISSTTPQMPATGKVISMIRELRPDMRILLGGPHVTLIVSGKKLNEKSGQQHRAYEAYENLAKLADVLISGDGELAIFEALKEDCPKLIDGDEPKLGLFMNNQIYEQTPYPARHLIDMKSYHYEIEGFKSTSLIAQLGCPFQCGFCGGRNSKSLRHIITRSSDSIVAEIRFLHERYGYTGFMFYDDELNVNKEMVALMNRIADLQEELGVEFRLRGFVKAELFNKEQAVAMYRAGFRWLLTGFESGSPRILSNINKHATQDDNTRAVECAQEHNLKVKALMSMGHPGETEDTINDSMKWLLKVRPDDFDCSIITTYPGTPYYDEAVPHATQKGVYTYTYKKNGDQLHAYDLDYSKVEDYYKGDPDGGYKSYVFTNSLSADDLVRMRGEFENTLRQDLKIEFNVKKESLYYEHSMGQSGSHLARFILRESRET